MTTTAQPIEQKCIDSIRILSADAIQKANSGHPGLPMGAAPMAYVLWKKHLVFNPKNPTWYNRDRFVLSAGHGSMLLYALQYLTGYESMTIDEIRNFRQWGSLAAGHPENISTPGVEITTGALGQGIASAVGLALAEAHMATRFNKPNHKLIDHYTYALVGDGCIMEGLTYEACSIAGHLGLGKLIVLFDENRISIDGPTDITFTEDVTRRFEACNWHVQMVEQGDTDLAGIAQAIAQAKQVTDKPSLIRVRTTIGYGSPNKANNASCHGAPLGKEEVAATRKQLKWNLPPFEIPQDVLDYMRTAIERGDAAENAWNETAAQYQATYPEDFARFSAQISGELPEGWVDLLPDFPADDPPIATRNHSGKCLNAIADALPGLMGGSADLTGSNKVTLANSGVIQRGALQHRNLHFGVREHAMAAICNGLAVHDSGLIPYAATFLVFSDYMRGAVRASAISNAGVIYIMTHDSIAVGEDGPTHQPIEHIATLRAIPNLMVIRPADGTETAGAYRVAIGNRARPTMLMLSRQKTPALKQTSAAGVERGAYIYSDSDTPPEIILIGTGTELVLCTKAAEQLTEEGIAVRVVSMPCHKLFDLQDESYQEQILPAAVTRRLAVEAGTCFGWSRYLGPDRAMISIDRFGVSAPGNVCFEKFGYTVENVIARAKALLK